MTACLYCDERERERGRERNGRGEGEGQREGGRKRKGERGWWRENIVCVASACIYNVMYNYVHIKDSESDLIIHTSALVSSTPTQMSTYFNSLSFMKSDLSSSKFS